MNYQKGISACIIAKNEENSIKRCLLSLSFADEIILLDSNSTDRTVPIAKKLKARVYKRKFDNFINQKNSCISYAKYEWILVLDADEMLSDELSHEIKKRVNSVSDEIKGFYLPRKTKYLNRWILHSGWYPNFSVRLFRNNYGKFEGINVHEKVAVQGKVQKLKNPILHFSYENISDHVEKINFYSTLIAKEKAANGYESSVIWAVMKSASKFILTYFWRLGFLDGKVGLVIAVLAAYYNFQKYIKIWEINNKQK